MSDNLHISFSSEWCERVFQEGCLSHTQNILLLAAMKKKNFSVMSWRKEKAFIIWAVQCTESQGENGTGEQKVANDQVPTFFNNQTVFHSTAIKLHFKWL